MTALRVGSVPLRWIPEVDQQAFRLRELDFYLNVPTRIRLWFHSRAASGPSGPGSDIMQDLRRLQSLPQERDLWIVHPKTVPLRERVHRLGLEILAEESPPEFQPGLPIHEEISHLVTGDGMLTFLQPTTWPPYFFPGLLAPLLTFDPPLDVLVDLTPLDRTSATHLLRLRVRAFKPHREEDPIWGLSSDDTETLLGDILQRSNRLFRVGVTVALHQSEPARLAGLREIASAEGIRLSPALFNQSLCQACFSESFDVAPTVTRLLDAESLSHLGMFEWPTTPSEGNDTLLGYDPEHRALVSYNRTSQPNPSSLVLGTPGSGKSTFAKVELLRSLRDSTSRAVILDPEGEYGVLVQHLQGHVVNLASPGYPVNPLACPTGREIEGKITRLPRLIAGGLGEESVHRVQSCLRLLYDRSVAPTLAELDQTLPDDDPVRARLWPLIQGPLRGLGHPAPGLPEEQVISFDLSLFDGDTVGLAAPFLFELIITWAGLFARTGPLFVTLDEVHVFLKDPTVRALLLSLLKRARKSGVVLTGITQNVGDFFLTDEGSLLVANAGTVLLFRQSPEDMHALVDRFHLPLVARQWLERVAPGEGLMIHRYPVPLVVHLTDEERPLTDTSPARLRRRPSR